MTAIHYENEKQKFPQTLILPTAEPLQVFLNNCASVGMLLNPQDIREILNQVVERMHSVRNRRQAFDTLPEFDMLIISRHLNEDQKVSLILWIRDQLGPAIWAEIAKLSATDSDGVLSYYFIDMLGFDIVLEYLPW